MKMTRRLLLVGLLIMLTMVLAGCTAEDALLADEFMAPMQSEPEWGVGLQLLVILTLASFATAILTLMTGFTRIVIVLSFVRNAVGTPQTPPTQVIIGLSLILTFFVMAPVWNNVNENALRPYLEGEIPQYEALSRIEQDVRGFMFKQTREKDLALFVHLSEMDQPDTPADVPTHVLIPAYAISELRTAFQMGFVLFVPFLVIDLVVSSMLMAMGMMMLPPSMISLPFKILLFVMVDGWHVIVRSLVESFVR